MTPAARHAAAIAVLDQILGGQAAEQALTRWARGARYAGSKDRAAVRDIVFAGLRQRRSRAHAGGAETGRGIVLGGLILDGVAPHTLFGTDPYGPPALITGEGTGRDAATPPDPVALDCPDWLWPIAADSLGAEVRQVFEVLRHRAPIGLRVNAAKTTRAAVIKRLCADGFAPQPSPLSPHALTLAEARGLERHPLYTAGLIEFQDPGAQRLVDLLPLTSGARILDYCAGGGGKALAVAARHDGPILAHDADPARLRDLPARAKRAGAGIDLAKGAPQGPFDGVILDVPCSGSGTWRRQPDAKWRLTPDRLAALQHTQQDILRRALRLCAPGGWIAYMTCSILKAENAGLVARVLADTPGLVQITAETLLPSDLCDGFFCALLRRTDGEIGTI